MRYATRLIAVVTLLCIVVLLTSLGQPSPTPRANAANFQMNPAPLSQFKAPISTPALMGLSRASGSKTWGPDALTLTRSPATSGPSQIITSMVPPGLLLFNSDPSATEQNEESLTETGPFGALVGGVNDFRGFAFVPAAGCTVTGSTQCYPSLNCPSASGFSVAPPTGRSLLKDGCLPLVVSNGTTYQPFGDPALDHDAQGNIYYGSLGFDINGGPNNGIVLARSTSALTAPGASCQNISAIANPCWTERVVSVDVQTQNNKCSLEAGACKFDDKDWVAVDRSRPSVPDPYRGSVYVVWNQFTLSGPAAGTSHMVLSRCTPSTTDPTGFSGCTTPMVISKPGDDFTGGGSFMTVGADGHIYLAYYNFGTPTTFYPVDGRVAVLSPGATSILGYINMVHLTQAGTADTYPCLPNTDPAGAFYASSPCKDNTYPDAIYSAPFRLPGFIKIAVGRAPGTALARVFTTFELCSQPAYYPIGDGHGNILYTGNCPKTDVIVAHTDVTFTGAGAFSTDPESYVDLTRDTPGQQFFPYPSIDEFTGALTITYESTQNDPFNNMIDVYAQISSDGGTTFRLPRFVRDSHLSDPGRITPSSYQVSADPMMYFGQGAPFCTGGGGCPGFWPQNGDYIQSLASFGRLYVDFSATYAQKNFAAPPHMLSFVDNTNPVFQDDDYLAAVFAP
jgi:hypothetical protein